MDGSSCLIQITNCVQGQDGFRRTIREKQQKESYCYANDLHEALLKKQGTNFWKCWNSKLGDKNR